MVNSNHVQKTDKTTFSTFSYLASLISNCLASASFCRLKNVSLTLSGGSASPWIRPINFHHISWESRYSLPPSPYLIRDSNITFNHSNFTQAAVRSHEFIHFPIRPAFKGIAVKSETMAIFLLITHQLLAQSFLDLPSHPDQKRSATYPILVCTGRISVTTIQI